MTRQDLSRQELLAVWTRHLDGGPLTAAESAALRTALAADDRLREVLLGDLALDGLLRNRLDDEEAGRAFVAGVAMVVRAQSEPPDFAARVRQRIVHSQRLRLRRARRRTGGRVLALAACLMLLLGGAWLVMAHGMGVHADLPSLVVVGQPAGTSRKLATGSELASDQDLVLTWADGTRAAVLAGSRLTVLPVTTGKSLRLTSGRIAVEAAPQPAGRPLTIRSPEALATVVGTAFVLDSAAGETRLAVEHGSVRLGAGSQEVLVAAGSRGLADRNGLRLTAQPLWSWSAGDPQSPSPTVGRRGLAPDGRPCLVAERADTPVIAVHFIATREGLFAYDPDAEVVCDVWLNQSTRWAGFYLQDDGSGRLVAGQPGTPHMGQWHIPLTFKDGWFRVRFPLRDVVDSAHNPLIGQGDRINHLMIQAQSVDLAKLYIDRLEVVPPER